MWYTRLFVLFSLGDFEISTMCTFLGEDIFFFRTIFEKLKYISSLCCFYRNIHESQANRRTYSNLKTIFKITFSRPSGFFFSVQFFFVFSKDKKAESWNFFQLKSAFWCENHFSVDMHIGVAQLHLFEIFNWKMFIFKICRVTDVNIIPKLAKL